MWIEKMFPLSMLLWLVAFVDFLLMGMLRVIPSNDLTGGIFVGAFGGAMLCAAIPLVAELFRR